MTSELEKPYQDLVCKAEFDPFAKARVDMLHRTLDAFGVTMNRTAVAGSLLLLDKMYQTRIPAYLDMEVPQNDQLIRMLTHFKQLQGKEAPPTGSSVDLPVES